MARTGFTMKTEKERKRQKTRRFLIAFVSFLLAFGCFSVLYMLISYNFDLSSLINAREDESVTETEVATEAEVSYSTRHYLLYCVNDEDNITDMRFLSIIRADVQKGVFTICTLSDEERVTLDGTTMSLLEHLKSGGTKRLVAAVEQFCGIKLDKYVCSDDIGFKKAINYAGQLKITIDRQINYRSDEFSLVLISGEQKLRGDELLKYFRYLGTIGDEGIDAQSQLVGFMLNQYINESNLENGDNLFSSVVNVLSTDITIMDFKNAKGTLQYAAENKFDVEVIPYFKNIVG